MIVVGLVIFTSRFESTRGLFWNGPRNLEPRSDDEDDTRAGTPSPSFRTTPTGRRLDTTYDIASYRAPYTAGLHWNRISNLEPSYQEAKPRLDY
ncbi:hypothetical protein AVEN_668-1 [Araneus ventricosus]|uniref:Uncharacterized protein n=1 Tax=Araneus ventricosus TaxID=182803 RepID=A0A4Y2BWN0_ARAVE|nr:hypothetical protein AVEN_668-1 [Araneus ventricosus]